MKKEERKKKQGEKTRASGPERSARLIQQVWDLAQPVCEQEGLELIHVEYQREAGGRTLRLYIDKPDGVTLDDCAAVSRQLNDLLEVQLDHEESFHLEVSSPGANRPLGRAADFERFKSHRVRIRTIGTLEGKRSFTGELLGLYDDGVRVSTPTGVVAIPLDVIRKAQLVS